MGRQLRRVPLDFSHPHGSNAPTWPGFLMSPDLVPPDCEHCDGTGSSPEGKELSDRWYGYIPFRPADNGSEPFTVETPSVRAFAERQCGQNSGYYGNTEVAIIRNAQRLCDLWNARWMHHLNQEEVDVLVDAGRLTDFTHDWKGRDNGGWVPNGYRPTAREVNEWSCVSMGHDSINQWIVAKFVAERLDIDTACYYCDGEGSTYRDAAHKEAYDNWEPTEPPVGEGWQMWETTSEGSAISPVFADPKELARYLSINWRNDGSFEDWMNMIVGDGWAPSVMTDNNGEMVSGVKAINS